MKRIRYNEKAWGADVYLDGKRVGSILEEEPSGGFRYYPRGSETGGELFKTLAEAKQSLETE